MCRLPPDTDPCLMFEDAILFLLTRRLFEGIILFLGPLRSF